MLVIGNLSDKNGDRENVIAFAKQCSWQSSGSYLAELITDDCFSGFERVFYACEQDKIIGFCALLSESCIENDSHFPWLDFLFVDEAYRGNGISRELICAAISYARSLNFKTLYLCTATHKNMYEKYGFHPSYTAPINENTLGTVMALAL